MLRWLVVLEEDLNFNVVLVALEQIVAEDALIPNCRPWQDADSSSLLRNLALGFFPARSELLA